MGGSDKSIHPTGSSSSSRRPARPDDVVQIIELPINKELKDNPNIPLFFSCLLDQDNQAHNIPDNTNAMLGVMFEARTDKAAAALAKFLLHLRALRILLLK